MVVAAGRGHALAVQTSDAALGALGLKKHGDFGDNGRMYGAEGPAFIVTKPGDGEPATFANGGTLGYLAPSRDAVRNFHSQGLANGGVDAGAPGPRSFAPTAYAAYLRDPAGNKICAYCFAAA
ncbi:VOC family protein [Hydrogenophaga crassostreae]|uniref:VOC family protein n=1 Tax=Hydrogenophaga crassostreae TaxID=1763535 RepID=UPI0018D34D16|nr:VOC family protein [Hydrogenophaga crassostreae]